MSIVASIHQIVNLPHSEHITKIAETAQLRLEETPPLLLFQATEELLI